MEVKHDLNATKKRMKELTRQKDETAIKEHMIEIYNLMAECDYRTLNLDLNNGFKIVCTILEDEKNG